MAFSNTPAGAVVAGRTLRGASAELRSVEHPEFKLVLVLSIAGVSPIWWAYRRAWAARLDYWLLPITNWPSRWDYEHRTRRVRQLDGQVVGAPDIAASIRCD